MSSRVDCPRQAFLALLTQLGGEAAPPATEGTFSTSTPLSRMHNWGVVAPALAAAGVSVDADAVARIVAGGAPLPQHHGHGAAGGPRGARGGAQAPS